MRILLVNWAKVWHGTGEGGGVNGYAQALALELAERGHDVCWLCSGITYVPSSPEARSGPISIRRHDDWRGIRVFEVINSPVFAPSMAQFNRPRREIRGEKLGAQVRSLMSRLRPDVVHLQNIEGLAASCVEAFKSPQGDWPGARIVYSLHNYHTICPQVYLMRGHRVPCQDFEQGHACMTCVEAPPIFVVHNKRMAEWVVPATDGHEARVLMPGHPAETEEDVNRPRPCDNDERSTTLPVIERPRAAQPPPAPSSLEPLTNDIRPVERSSKEPTKYAERRFAMIEMLNACDRVLAVSSFVHRKFESLGVEPARLRTMTIGTHAAQAAGRHRIAEPPPLEPARPVRLVFMGHNNYFKGLPMLADSLELLETATLSGLELTVAGPGIESIADRFRALKGLAGLELEDGYRPDDIPRLLGAKDLGIVPSVWWDNGPQTVFEMLACGLPVLGANIGGIPDFVLDGVNGLLFRANDREDLASKIRAIVDNPTPLASLRRGIRPPKSIQTHAEELLDLYEELLAANGV